MSSESRTAESLSAAETREVANAAVDTFLRAYAAEAAGAG
ncbi:TetR/AcrR family transcriptional regulator C-terminal domain-containing protein [Streptomyces sp. ME19-01-6]|nr:TetR/AcrR family transcriptional regulator C-terminal domain-containing protein [Streptomyces sp. ME19-01-6]MDX3229505.1 TetR/AcrR family transcriptional regulator C-terminal domain-containing protein [Streptomyces sp. ME19-01-6]